MIGFLIRKTFYDLWDNLFRIALLNVGFMALTAVPLFVPPLIPIPALSWLVLGVGVLCCSIYLAAAGVCLKRVSDYSFFGFRDFLSAFKKAWLSGLVAGLLTLAAALVIGVIIPFYTQISSPVGAALAIVIFWVFVTCLLSLQFFLAIRARMDNPVRVSVKKCFIIFFDNTGFCFFSFIHNAVLLALSAFLAFLIPGPAGILLFLDEALRLRLLKYDWLSEHPEAAASGKRPKIPWDELLIEERENTGHRTLRSFIFPWKD
jgi:uncharacterized membrane protein YesL